MPSRQGLVSFPHYELMIAVLRHQILHPGIHAEHVEIHRHWFAYQRRFITVPDSNAGQGLLWIALPSKKFLLHLEFVISNVLHRTARVLCTEGYKSAEEENHSFDGVEFKTGPQHKFLSPTPSTANLEAWTHTPDL